MVSISSYENKVHGVSIVIPVLNEAENIKTLISGIESIKKGTYGKYVNEVIFVDDGSSDGTVQLIKDISKEINSFSIRVIERDIKRGTVNAQLHGISVAENEAVIIMDGDLQHPVTYIEKLVEEYMHGYDLVVASRYVAGGKTKRTVMHGLISRGANILAKFMLPWVKKVKDPISGFFIVNRKIVPYNLIVNGFNKLALYILTCRSGVGVSEIPFAFEERSRGKSKVSTGGIYFMVKYVGELRYYRYLRRVINGNRKPVSSSSEYESYWLGRIN